jgi:hypothetical protein
MPFISLSIIMALGNTFSTTFNRSGKNGHLFSSLTTKEREKTSVNKIRNKTGDIRTGTTEIQMIISDWNE